MKRVVLHEGNLKFFVIFIFLSGSRELDPDPLEILGIGSRKSNEKSPDSQFLELNIDTYKITLLV